MVPAGTTRKSHPCRRFLRSASTLLFAGAALVSQTAFGQESAPERYAPPVHVQPAAWSVLEQPEQPAAPPVQTSRGSEIANMAQYMRMQNQAVTSHQDAQVNAALTKLQNAKSGIAQAQHNYSQGSPRQPFPRSAPPVQSQPPQVYPTPQVHPLHVNPRRDVAAQQVPQRATQTPPRQQVQQRQQVQHRQQVQQQQRQFVQQRPVQRPTIQQPVPRRGIGLQDRISQAMKKTFSRPEPVREAPRAVAQQIPTRAIPNQPQQVAQVDHTVGVYAGERELDLPMLVDQRTASPKRAARVPVARAPRRAPTPREYRPQRSQNDRVIVPSFVETEPDLGSELQLASRQETIGSGLRRPKVSSHSQPGSYVQPRELAQPRDLAQPRSFANRTAQQQVSVFKNASTQIGSQRPQEDREEIDRLRQELEDLRSDSDNELPQRPDADKSLLDMADEDAAEEARRARSSEDAELDSLEDEEDDLEIDEDEDTGPPVFDERGCEELRGMLLGKSIRDISLDVSPPASGRRDEFASLSRSWTDQAGTVLATGTMLDLRRGYVILDSGQKLPYAKLSEADWSAIAENWLLPTVCAVGQRGSVQRNWSPMTVSWHASSLCHKPLYFENVQLERYGHSRGPYMQPIHSTFHFFRSILFLPYNQAIHPPNECQYSLGYYRPGNCAPWLIDPIPFSREGIRRQALTSVGLAFIP